MTPSLIGKNAQQGNDSGCTEDETKHVADVVSAAFGRGPQQELQDKEMYPPESKDDRSSEQSLDK